MLRLPAVIALALLGTSAFAACLSIEQAGSKIGATGCVRGTVVQVAEGRKGNFYLNFCADYRKCPFSIFVPRGSQRDVGDVRQLQGKLIEIHGKIQQYDGRAEIVLTDARQLKGESARIPPLPKDFDVQRKGRFSAGKFREPRSQNSNRSKKQRSGEPAEEDWQ
ncbi:MAG: hypothetical protein ACE14M_04790 [Terriglobales bacterium]